MKSVAHFLTRVVPFVLWLATLAPSWGASIVVGIGGSLTSLDPHFHNNSSNANVAEHLFETLIARDAGTGVLPGLAMTWKLNDDNIWTFKLRPDVRFHDGTPFTADDVLFSLERVKKIKKSPSSYAIYTRSIKSVRALDALTVEIVTHGPAPMLLRDLAAIQMVSKQAVQGASTEDFNSGKALIGTGPFKFGELRRNERIELLRNKDYWGKKPQWDKATILLLPNEAARTAALLSGRADVIETVPTQDIRRISAHPGMTLFRSPSFRLMYLHLDSGRKHSPFVRSKNEIPLASNPLHDVRVRRAISKLINRQAIVSRLMEGMGEASAQLVVSTSFGYVPDLLVEQVDVAEARRLLALAGYPNGFRLTIHSTTDHYANDKQVAQAIAIMLSKAGIESTVESLPASVFFSRANKLEFSLLLAGWNSDAGMVESAMKALLARYSPDTGMGSANRGRYDNPEFDRALATALTTFDDDQRSQLLQHATRIAMEEVGIIPLYFQNNVWAARKGLQLEPRQDGRTYIHHIEIDSKQP
nr:ABC transporter substrate-binding protein [uncultured Undibacterium sp.]